MSEGEVEQVKLKVLTYNVNRVSDPQSKKEVVDFVRGYRYAQAADRKIIFCFQLISRHLLDEIHSKAAGIDFVALYEPYESSSFSDFADFGLGILTPTHYVPQVVQKHRDGGKLYGLTTLLTREEGKSITITNVHLDNTSESTRLKQALPLLKIGQTAETESMLIGDFNGMSFCEPDTGVKHPNAHSYRLSFHS